MPEPEFLIVGLGNPGEEYERTPHNMGFLAIDQLAGRNAMRVSCKEDLALVGLGSVAGHGVAVAKPQTYMNLSGGSVKRLLDRYEIPPARLILVYDEADLPWGALRIRERGSAAGHNGVKSVIGSIGTDAFVRLRIGIQPERKPGELKNFVLGKFKSGQMKDVEELAGRAADAVESIIAEGAEMAMAKYNRRAQGLNTEEE